MTTNTLPKFYGPCEHLLLRAMAQAPNHTVHTLQELTGVSATAVYTFLNRAKREGLLVDGRTYSLRSGVDVEALIAFPLLEATRLRRRDYLEPLFHRYLVVDPSLPPEQWMDAQDILLAIDEYANEASHPSARRMLGRYMKKCGIAGRFVGKTRVCVWPVRRVSA